MHVIKIISLIIFELLTKTFASNLHAYYYYSKKNIKMLGCCLRSTILYFLFIVGRELSVCNLLSHQVTRQTP